MTALAAVTPIRPRSTLRQPPSFRGDVDGLAAVVVLVLVAADAGVPGFAGGSAVLGAAFAIVGFLLARRLVQEGLSTGGVDLPGFIARLLARVLPTVSVVVVVTAVGSRLLLPPPAAFRAMQDLLAAAGGWADLRPVAPGGVAQQFSAVSAGLQLVALWACLLTGAVLLARRRPRRGLLAVACTIAVPTVAAGVIAVAPPRGWPAAPLLGPVWQIGLGAAVALVLPLSRRSGRPRRVAAGVGALGGGGAAAIVLGVVQPAPLDGLSSAALAAAGAAALAAAGAAALLAAGSLRPDAVGARMLGLPPFRWTGRIALAWYLWHWPALVLVHARTGALPWSIDAAIVAGALLPAVLTVLFIERPVQRWLAAHTDTGPASAVGLLAAVVAMAVVLGIGTALGARR